VPKLTVFAIALLLSTLTASIANAQAGKSNHRSRVTPEDGQEVIDVFNLLLGGSYNREAPPRFTVDEREERRDREREERRRKRARNEARQQRSGNNPPEEDASVAGGGD